MNEELQRIVDKANSTPLPKEEGVLFFGVIKAKKEDLHALVISKERLPVSQLSVLIVNGRIVDAKVLP